MRRTGLGPITKLRLPKDCCAVALTPVAMDRIHTSALGLTVRHVPGGIEV